MKGFFNTKERKETSVFWIYRITRDDQPPFKIIEYDKDDQVLKYFEFDTYQISEVRSKI